MAQILISTKIITIIKKATSTTTTIMTIGKLFPAASGTEVVTALIRTGAIIKPKETILLLYCRYYTYKMFLLLVIQRQ